MSFLSLEIRNEICLEVNFKCLSFDFDPLLKWLFVFSLLYEMNIMLSCECLKIGILFRLPLRSSFYIISVHLLSHPRDENQSLLQYTYLKRHEKCIRFHQIPTLLPQIPKCTERRRRRQRKTTTKMNDSLLI